MCDVYYNILLHVPVLRVHVPHVARSKSTNLYVWYLCTHIHVWALSDFDGDFLPDLGTQHPPAEICPDNSSLSPIALKIGLNVVEESAASFELMYMWFGLTLELSGQISAGELFWAKILKVDFAEEFPKKKIMIV